MAWKTPRGRLAPRSFPCEGAGGLPWRWGRVSVNYKPQFVPVLTSHVRVACRTVVSHAYRKGRGHRLASSAATLATTGRWPHGHRSPCGAGGHPAGRDADARGRDRGLREARGRARGAPRRRGLRELPGGRRGRGPGGQSAQARCQPRRALAPARLPSSDVRVALLHSRLESPSRRKCCEGYQRRRGSYAYTPMGINSRFSYFLVEYGFLGVKNGTERPP